MNITPFLGINAADPNQLRKIVRAAGKVKGLRMLYLESEHPIGPVVEALAELDHIEMVQWEPIDGRYRAMVHARGLPWTSGQLERTVVDELYRGLRSALQTLAQFDQEQASVLAADLYNHLAVVPALQRRFDGLLHQFTGARHHGLVQIQGPDGGSSS